MPCSRGWGSAQIVASQSTKPSLAAHADQHSMRALTVLTALLLAAPTAASAQGAVLVYRLGKDTLAVEQYTRTPTGMSGEMVQRNGPAVVRFTYSL